MTEPLVSIIICTLNRSALLTRSLKALRSQRSFQGQFEVLVIDNGSIDDTERIVGNSDLGSIPVRYVREPKLGLSRARNRGITESRGEILVFLDDDAFPQPEWLEILTKPFFTITPTPTVVAGEVTPEWGSPRPAWLSDDLLGWFAARLGWGVYPRPLKQDEWVLEANCAARRKALLDAGGFPEALGRMGSVLLSGDHLVFEYIQESGGVIYFEPRAIVVHHIHSERLNQNWLRRRAFYQGVTDAISNRLRIASGRNKQPIEMNFPNNRKAWNTLLAGRGGDVDTSLLQAQLGSYHAMGYFLQRTGIIELA